MKPVQLSFAGLLAVLLLGGCVVSHARKVPGVNYTKTEASEIELLYQEPSKPYEVVGFVSVDKGGGASDAAVEREFRTKAASLGANAVIIEALPVHGLITVVQGHGRAIRWKQ